MRIRESAGTRMMRSTGRGPHWTSPFSAQDYQRRSAVSKAEDVEKAWALFRQTFTAAVFGVAAVGGIGSGEYTRSRWKKNAVLNRTIKSFRDELR
jgi:hypothetical protein